MTRRKSTKLHKIRKDVQFDFAVNTGFHDTCNKPHQSLTKQQQHIVTFINKTPVVCVAYSSASLTQTPPEKNRAFFGPPHAACWKKWEKKQMRSKNKKSGVDFKRVSRCLWGMRGRKMFVCTFMCTCVYVSIHVYAWSDGHEYNLHTQCAVNDLCSGQEGFAPRSGVTFELFDICIGFPFELMSCWINY